MERAICGICEKFFVKTEKKQVICNDCYEKDKEDFEIVKSYLSQNKRATIMDVYFDTKIPIKTLKRYIKEGRIDVIDE